MIRGSRVLAAGAASKSARGEVYCLLEGPDEEAIRKHHEAIGVPCGDVHPVTGLL